MYQIPINFLESLVQNMSFSFPDISNSATEKFFPALILDCLVNILLLLLGRIININFENMLGFEFGFIAVIINVIIFCYWTKSNWDFLLSVFVVWSIVNLWSFIVTISYNIQVSLEKEADGFGSKDKNWLSNLKSEFDKTIDM